MVHINLVIHKILEFIKQSDRAYSFKEIETHCKLKITPVITALKRNPKIFIENNKIYYLSEFSIRSLDDLRDLLKNRKEGIELERLDDGPFKVSKLLEVPEIPIEKAQINKKKSKEINLFSHVKDDFIVLRDLDNSQVVYYFDSSLKLSVDDKIKLLWDEVTIPDYQDLLEELKKAGINSMTKVVSNNLKEAKTKIKKKKTARRKIKITNTHVKDLNLEEMDYSG